MSQLTILIASGGTGGHLYPTIAVAEEIQRLRPSARVIFIGTRDRIESREVPRLGYPFFPISIEAPRRSPKTLVRFPFSMTGAIMSSLRVIRRERPQIMLGGGAYLSVPVGFAARSSGIPIALLEINSVAGTANKILSRIARKLFLAYPESRRQFDRRIATNAIICGTPVRGDLGANMIGKVEARASFGLDPNRETILAFGGSLGARAINEAMAESIERLTHEGYNILWQSGKGNGIETLQARFAANPFVRVQEYIYDMEMAYAASDLVICRAGASSLAEVARLGKPTILVPYPHAAANHQEKNARAFEATGAALVLRDSELREKLAPLVVELMQDERRREEMSGRVRERDNPRAATEVAEWLIAEAEKRIASRM